LWAVRMAIDDFRIYILTLLGDRLTIVDTLGHLTG
jgi:hypothetical protein